MDLNVKLLEAFLVFIVKATPKYFTNAFFRQYQVSLGIWDVRFISLNWNLALHTSAAFWRNAIKKCWLDKEVIRWKWDNVGKLWAFARRGGT